jgi:hypothetical protein
MHVYDTNEQRICLYYRKAREWNSSMFLSDTIIPWASEWLLHHELWVMTGVWSGGGIHNAPKIDLQLEEVTNFVRHDEST